VIFDASGYWLRAIDALIEYAREAQRDDQQAKRFIAQEHEHRREIRWMLEIIDVAVEALLLCVNKQASKGFIKRDQFYMPLELFYKIPFFIHFLDILAMARSVELTALNPEVARVIDELHELEHVTLQHGQDEAMAWAFHQVFDETELRDYSPASRPLVRLRMDFAPLKRMSIRNAYPCYIYFPRLVVPYLLGTEALPHPTVKEWAWTLFGLPQAAAYGIDVGAPYEREDRAVMYSAVNSGVGWFLDHYGAISSSEDLDGQTIIKMSYWTGKRELIGRLGPPRRA
jgi:hypothetical protein